MTQIVYSFDPHGTDVTNYIKNEPNSLIATLGEFKCLIPKAAPFYKKDLVIVANGKTLVEGKDYYLGHQYVRGTHQTAQAIYGSLMILNKALTVPYSISYRTLGGQYTVTDTDITTYLANKLTEPTTARWEDIMGEDRYFPPVDIAYDIDNWRGEAELVDAFNELGDTIETQDPKADDIVNLYENWMTEEEKVVTESQWAAHIANRNNPHATKWHQAGALKSDGIAQNANAIEGLTIDQLATQVAAQQGITVSKYFPLNSQRVLTGDFVLTDGLAGISRYAGDTTLENEALIQLSSGNSHINGDRNVTVKADSDKATPNETASLRSGNNVLSVKSSGADQANDHLYYNDQQVLTAETLKDHLPSDANAGVNVITKSTTQMTFAGKGSTGSPLSVTFNYPSGSTTVNGTVYLTSALDNSKPTYAGTPAAVKSLYDRLANLIPKTRKVNGIALSSNILIPKSSFGIERIQNTSDANLPVNEYYQSEIDKYALTAHSHNVNEFSLNYATTALAGIVEYAYTLTDGDVKAMNSYMYSGFDAQIRNLEGSIASKVPANALRLNKYGIASYLPVPAIATYPAAGPNTISQSTVGELELDGTLVLLRNGSDILESGVYYAYATLNANGSIKKYTATTSKYQPDFLPAGVTAKAVYRGHDGVFILRDSADSYYVVLTNGTMEAKYHTASKFSTALSWGHQLMPVIVGDYVYFIWHQFGNYVYQFTASRVLLSSIGKGAVTPTTVTFSGTDPFGNVQTNVTTYNLVPSGISTDPTAQVLAIDTSGGKWTTRNVRQATLNYDMVAEGNKVRVMSYVSTYFVNAYMSAVTRFNTSYVIDFDLLTATLDTLDGFPIVFGTDGLPVTTLRKGGESIGMPGGNSNNTTCVIRTNGKTYSLNSYGIERPPYLIAFKYNEALTEFERIKDANVASAVIGSWINFTGNYGSVIHINCRGVQFTKGNCFIGANADGTYIQAQYDLNTRYITGDNGYGPTNTRTNISQSRYNQLKKTIFNSTLGYSDGAVLYDSALSNFSRYEPTTVTTSVPISITTTAFNALKALFFAQLAVAYSGSRFISAYLSVYVTNDPQYPVVGVYTYLVYNDDTLTSSAIKFIAASLTVDSRSSITTAAIDTVFYTGTNATNATSLSSFGDISARAMVGVLADGNLVLILGANGYYGMVGSSGSYSLTLVYTPSTKTWAYKRMDGTNSYQPGGYYFTAEKGLFTISNHVSGEGIAMTFRGTTLATIAAATTYGTGYLSSSRVAEGWYVYMTEDMPYVVGGIRYTLPVQMMDIRTYFPGDYQNRTFYLYVDVQSGSPIYVWSSVKNPDSSTATYIGYCTTDNTRITKLEVERVTRLDQFKELVNHRASITAHGIGDNTKATIGLTLLANKSPSYNLNTSVFADVFNSWKRISHYNTDYTQPFNASEISAWTYDAAADTIKCTLNTATYVGFISPNKIADYEFDTVVGLPSSATDTDDDIISIIIGYAEVVGVQHTLSVLRTRNLGQGPDMKFETQFGVYYDYQLPDQKTVKTVDTSAVETVGSWKGFFSRIHVKRVGDTFTVKATKLDTKTYATVVESDYVFSMTFTLNDLPELTMFKGPTQYGYGAFSQNQAQYINYLRPDADGRNFYATTTEVLKAAYWQRNVAILTGNIGHGGILPIPAGFTREECRYYINANVFTNGTKSSPLCRMNFSYDPTSYVVTATVTRQNGEVSPGTLSYTVVASPGFKLFK